MRSGGRLVRRLYGDRLLHLVVLLAAFALAGYAVLVLGVENLFNPAVWWQSIAVWFAVAVIGHDLVLFPLYALAERLLPRSRTRGRDDDHGGPPGRPSLTNYLRLPTLAAGLTFLLFFPGIIEQGGPAYTTATGQDQHPFASRWLLLVAGFYLVSAVCYLVRIVVQQRSRARSVVAS